MAAQGVRVDEMFDCGGMSEPEVTRRLLDALRPETGYRAVQVGPQQIQFARSFRPTWAIVAGIVTLPFFLVGLAFLLVKKTECCTASIGADHRGTRVKLSGRVGASTLAAVRIALANPDPSPGAALGTPVASVAEAQHVAHRNLPQPPVHQPGGAPPAPSDDASERWTPPPVGVTGLIGSAPSAGNGADLDGLVPPVPRPPAPAPVAAATASNEDTVSVGMAHRADVPAEVPLVVVLDDGREVPLLGLALVGRDPAPRDDEHGAVLVGVDDPDRTVSKTHLAIGVDHAGAWVADRGSVNGTTVVDTSGHVNSVGDRGRVPLSPGDEVRFGDRSLRLVGSGGKAR